MPQNPGKYKFDLKSALQNAKQSQQNPIYQNPVQTNFVPTNKSIMTGDKSFGDTNVTQQPVSPVQQLQNPNPQQPVFQQQQPSPMLPTPQQPPASNFSAVDQLQNKQQGGEFQQDFLGGLNPNLSSQLQQNIQDFASGDAMEANKAASNQALATQIRNMRSQAGGALAGQIGQGGALAGQQQVEQGVLSQLANKGLQEGLQETQMKEMGTQLGMQMAQQQQNAKQFGQTLEADYQKQALSEKMAQDKNWLDQQQIDQTTAQLEGYTDQNGNHVKGTMELNAEKFGLEKEMYADDQTWKSMNLAIDAGDYVGANMAAKEAGIPTIDWTNIQEQEQSQKISEGIMDIEKMLATVDADTNPVFYDNLIKQYGKLYGQKQKLLGLPFDQADIDNIINDINTGNATPQSTEAYGNFLNKTVVDWWENGMGKNMGMMLDGEAADWYSTLSDPLVSDEVAAENAKNLSQVIWSAYAAENGYALSEKQTQLLKDSGLAPAADKETSEMESQEKIDAYWNGTKSHGELKGASDPEHELHDVYNEINDMATGWVKESGWENKSGAGNNGHYFTSSPAKGSYINYNGKLYKVVTDAALKKVTGTDYQQFQIQDVNTSELVTVKAKGGDSYSGSGAPQQAQKTTKSTKKPVVKKDKKPGGPNSSKSNKPNKANKGNESIII